MKVPEETQKQIEPYPLNLLKGKIFCGRCGGRRDRKKNHQHYIYRCTANYMTPESCPGNCIREEVIIEAVTKTLLEYAERVSDEPPVSGDAKPIETKLAELQVETSYDEDTLKTLYEALVAGEITEQEFIDFRNRYHHRQAQQKERWMRLSLQKAEQVASAAEAQELIDALEKFYDARILTHTLIDKLVERIEVLGNRRVYVGLNT